MSTEIEYDTKGGALPPSDGFPAKEEQKEKLFMATQWQLIRWKFFRHKLAVSALVILGIFYFGVLFAEFIAPYDPHATDKDFIHVPPQRIRFFDSEGRFHLRPFVYGLTTEMDKVTLRINHVPDPERVYRVKLFAAGDEYRLWGLFKGNIHLIGTEEGGRLFIFGTDRLGRDLFSMIVHGSRISLSIGLMGIAVSFFLGITIGGMSGYYGGALDTAIQRTIEFLRSIPTLPLWMGLSAALPPHWSVIKVYFGIVIILSLIGWTSLARVVRGKFMALREEDFIMAAKFDGAGDGRMIFRYLLPSFYSHIIASLTLSIPGMILGETALSFIGLGLQPPAISWGVLLRESQAIRVLANAPWLLIPGLFVIVVILAFNFVGDGLRDAADPYASV